MNQVENNNFDFQEIENAIDFKIWNAKKERDGLLVRSLLFIWTGIVPLICLGMAYMQHATMKKYEVCKQELNQNIQYRECLEIFKDRLIGLKKADRGLSYIYCLNDAPLIIWDFYKQKNGSCATPLEMEELNEKIERSELYLGGVCLVYQLEKLFYEIAVEIQRNLEQVEGEQPKDLTNDEKLNISDGSCNVSLNTIWKAIDFQIWAKRKNFSSHYGYETSYSDLYKCRDELKDNKEYRKFMAAFAAQNCKEIHFVRGMTDPLPFSNFNNAPIFIYRLCEKCKNKKTIDIEDIKKTLFYIWYSPKISCDYLCEYSRFQKAEEEKKQLATKYNAIVTVPTSMSIEGIYTETT